MPYKVIVYGIVAEIACFDKDDARQVASDEERLRGNVTRIVNITQEEYNMMLEDSKGE